MRNFALVAAGVVAAGAFMFTMAAPKARDHERSVTHVLFNSDECDGVPATVTGSEGRIPWDGSNQVAVAVPGKIWWRLGEGNDVVLRGDADDLARIRLEDGTLKVCGEIDDSVDIILPGRAFEKVTLAGAGELTMEDVDQTDLELTLAGAGRVTAQGRTDDVKVTIAGAGDALLGRLATKRLALKIMGAGKAEASPTEDADVTIMGAGDVELLTRPARHDFTVMGAGDVTMPDDV